MNEKNGIILLENNTKINTTVHERFGYPPVSVLNRTTSGWYDKKRKWKRLGIKSEEGRGNEDSLFNTLKSVGGKKYDNSIEKYPDLFTWSIFDPVLTDIIYGWFCPKEGIILDPFAGGSVRGIVATTLGYKYVGIELRKEQVEANYEQANNILEKEKIPKWICGDSNEILDSYDIKKYNFDFIFTCPPYFNLERYSKIEQDLSNMSLEMFYKTYESIIIKSLKLLKKNHYACFVVGDVRDKNGYYINLPGETVNIFLRNGCKLYNEIIDVKSVGSKRFTFNSLFGNSKKIVKIHENVYLFEKTEE